MLSAGPSQPPRCLLQRLSPPAPGGLSLSRAWGSLQQTPIVCWPECTCSVRPSPVSQLLASRGTATPHLLKLERRPFFSLFSPFLPLLSVKWSSPQGSREQHSLPGFLESSWLGDRVRPGKQRRGSRVLAKAPELLEGTAHASRLLASSGGT